MEDLLTIFFVLQIIIAVLLIVLVVTQKTSGDSLSGIGGGMSNNGIISKRAVSNLLTKGTMILVTLFMLNCLFLGAIITRMSRNEGSKIESYIKDNSGETTSKEIQIPEE
ncbi:preprotein translocase subunit SecG [Pseudomonadota bacterium]